MRPSHRAFTQYIVSYGFTSENQTTSKVGYLNLGTGIMLVSRVPFRQVLSLKFAIWPRGCDDVRT